MVGSGLPNPISRRSGRRARRAWAAGAAAGVLAAAGLALGPVADAASGPTGPSFYYVAADGALWGVPDGGSQAVPLGPAGQAAPGAHVAAVRLPGGSPSAFFVGTDGTVFQSCPQAVKPVAVTKPGFATSGSVVTAAVVAGQYAVAADGIPTPQPARARATVRPAEISNPCSPPSVRIVSNVSPSYVSGGAMASAGTADGGWGLFWVDTSGAVDAQWRLPGGKVTEKELTPAGTATPGGGLAAVPGASGVTLFFTGHDGQVYVAHPAEGGGLADTPKANPTAPTAVPDGAPLTAAPQGGGLAVGYVAGDGTFTVAALTLTGDWQRTDGVGKAGSFAPGSQVGSYGGADWDDWYCGTPPPFFWHFHGPVPGPDPQWTTIGQGNGGPGFFFAAG
ncbi:hypothetical protein [Actinacidiphila acidipaludis]|uniref:Uncharacterized protein n=1 Tax=Actinacidiphila acidipaludis TaxID=2873382 RepID=A0ABS7Q6J1_9ACTN|nr:hypothetical protein [Streptomyces acidipaludis]MBY8878750.1 hypothetical protein [Streptomyces acidipaludis]